ncbi:MAG TPA: AraC family transcriptional regulator [Burkholderiales bacterium]|jgi:AraC-like DNA-binding protein
MTAPAGRIRAGRGAPGIERMEAHFHGRPFAPHRHDTYAIGLTIAGVQSFNFRGARWHCLPGQCHILHPDELHDGAAGTQAGFGYRMLYLDPALLREALGGGALPFVAAPVVEAHRLPSACDELWEIDAELDDLASTGLVSLAAQLLQEAAGARNTAPEKFALGSLARVRERIAAGPARRIAMAALERDCGLDRWTLARQFRAAYGVSPSRFRTLRQLAGVRAALVRGTPLTQAALDAGFADQSHMSRQFKCAYGMTPARWVAALA